MSTIHPTTHTIDASDQKIGRVASVAAKVLMGKNRVDFAKNKIPAITVYITNASKVAVSDTKKKETIYKEYSGYPGGQKEISMESLISKRGMDAVFKKAIKGMLPPNKLRAQMLKNLVITE